MASTMFQVCGYVEAVGFHVQNAYKMAYDDKNTTFEPLNSERLRIIIITKKGRANHEQRVGKQKRLI